MVAASWPAGLSFIRKEEGGNDDDPNDHGGRTSRGVIQSEWNKWRTLHPGNDWPEDVWKAPDDQIDAIYKQQYWEPYGDILPAGLDVFFADFSVNAGRQQAVKCLQRALGISADGMLGIETKAAITQADTAPLIRAYAEQRRKFYQALAQFPRYGKGWMARTDRCEALAESMVGPPTTKPEAPPSILPSPKANPKDIKKPTVHPESGTLISAIMAYLTSFRDSIQSLTGIPHSGEILAVIALALFAASLYGFWQRQKAQEQVG